jgi:hypothetical protein
VNHTTSLKLPTSQVVSGALMAYTHNTVAHSRTRRCGALPLARQCSTYHDWRRLPAVCTSSSKCQILTAVYISCAVSSVATMMQADGSSETSKLYITYYTTSDPRRTQYVDQGYLRLGCWKVSVSVSERMWWCIRRLSYGKNNGVD